MFKAEACDPYEVAARALQQRLEHVESNSHGRSELPNIE
jgi:hypothetical protein